MKLPSSAITLIETWRLGFLASVSAEGKPNVSPKGTFIVVDPETIAFAEMRSPNTMANLAHQAEVEVSFVDILTRRGIRIRGEAEILPPDHALLPRFTEIWGTALADMFNAIVRIPATTVTPFATPAYEVGQTEAELKALWQAKIAAQ